MLRNVMKMNNYQEQITLTEGKNVFFFQTRLLPSTSKKMCVCASVCVSMCVSLSKF